MDNHTVSRVSSYTNGDDEGFHFPEGRNSSTVPPSSSSYWLDACEDVDVSGFVDFGGAAAAAVVPQVIGRSDSVPAVDEDDPGFFSDLDRFLSSIKDDESLLIGVGGGSGRREAGAGEVRDERAPQANGIRKHFKEMESEDKSCGEERGERGKQQQQNGDTVGSDRPTNRAHLSERSGDERGYMPRRHLHNGFREWSTRKRGRLDWEESERRGGYHRSNKRDRDGYDKRDNRDRDWRERERRGYWERDRTGKVVFCVGPWEPAEATRETKKARLESPERAKSPEKKVDEKRDKPVEEQARKYQLDVLEQAKK